MGVPAFFRWLSKKYPSITVPIRKESPQEYHFDNLYLDMNGIIHPCSHPENKPAPATEKEMFLAIFEYVEDIMRIVKPQKILYMAIDGVTPRAKMNQQRSRRFRAVQEAKELQEEVNKVKERLRVEGKTVREKEKSHFDSNVITPGTDFMLDLAEELKSWINSRLSPGFDDKYGIWPKDLVVIISDSSSPGEGEHKIMEFIRKQKASKDYNPALSHCLYGADADLIMLGLATHEPNFTIIREKFQPNQPRPCELCGQMGHLLKECDGEESTIDQQLYIPKTEFIFVRLNILREYLEKESQKCKVKLDLERFIDDWIFMCFFVGNDFLPHLPSLQIRENAIDRLITLYKTVMESSTNAEQDYLTNNGFVNKARVQLMLLMLGELEDDIFKSRKIDEANFRNREKRNKIRMLTMDMKRMSRNRQETWNAVTVSVPTESETRSRWREDEIQSRIDRIQNNEDPDYLEPEDNVQLQTINRNYYELKFGDEVGGDVEKFGRHVADEYFKGLCWVLQYYYQGCPDWKWYYPYHYAPFASDFGDCVKVDTTFDGEAQPFRPLEQLMAVFPAASSKSLPPTWRKLMTDSDSPIHRFYPETFKIDLNGKRAAWMGVALLPFIDEVTLLESLKGVYGDLTEHEKLRNSLGEPLIFLSKSHSQLAKCFQNLLNTGDKMDIPKNDEAQFRLLAGSIRSNSRVSQLYVNIICCEFFDPTFEKGFVFPARLLTNAKIPEKVLGNGMNWRSNDHFRQSSARLIGQRMGPPSIQRNSDRRTRRSRI